MIKNTNKYSTQYLNWFTLFQVGIIIIVMVLSSISLIMVYHTNNSYEELKERIEIIEGQNPSLTTITNEDKLVEYINIIDSKSDAAIDKVVAIVSVLFTVVTLFGGLVAFKAPKDIDSRLNELNEEIQKAKTTIEESRYLIRVRESLQESTTNEKIKALTSIITDYPSYSDAYYYRGCLWDDLNKYDDAIVDYKNAMKRGLDKDIYYNCIAVAYDKKGDKNQAVIFYTKVIKEQKDKDNLEFLSDLYSNRGSCYDDMNEYDLALNDYEQAIILNPSSDSALLNRSTTYRNLAEKQVSDDEKLKYFKLAQIDLLKAIKI